MGTIRSLLLSDDLASIAHGKCSDIFAFLGMHKSPIARDVVVRAFLPFATQVQILDVATNTLHDMHRVHENGVFELLIQNTDKFLYKLRITTPQLTYDIEDPYRFSSAIEPYDLYLFCEGTHQQTHSWMGNHEKVIDDVKGIHFVVWAPEALRVSVVGDFNGWDGRLHVMRNHIAAGVWEIFIPNVEVGQCYKYELLDKQGNLLPLKADPYAISMQHPPKTASITTAASDYQWHDQKWCQRRTNINRQYQGPVSVYEVHLGSWRRHEADNEGKPVYLSYRELAQQLIPYAKEMGFTHIQLMPISEYPFDGSWGYQPIGLFAPTSRFGSIDDFKHFVDVAHQNDIGILLDWVPGHFPTDEYGLGKFDGSCLYEHEDKRKGFHPDWNTLIYNYGRKEVVSYLLSNALYWFEQFHIDGLRVDAVASMLYLDYSRKEGEWLPNHYGGRENLEAIALIQQVNKEVYANHSGAMMVAEESTAWPNVSRPVDKNGLGFGFKWNMGWMNDTLSYMKRDPLYRKHHHNEFTFSLIYSFSENFILPLSHDEVVHGKGSLIAKMPGDRWQQFANLRAYFGFMWTHPGKKLLFMGGEFAQLAEWNHDQSLDWHLLDIAQHAQTKQLVTDLNNMYKHMPALHELDCESHGFQWLMSENHEQSIFTFLRFDLTREKPVLVVVNMTPQHYPHYRLGVPLLGQWQEVLNTDDEKYGGSGQLNMQAIHSQSQCEHGFDYMIEMTIAPLATQIFEWRDEESKDTA